jgi:dihydrofolate reductase
MKCSVFIATSVDGYIATPDGGVEWLENAGNPDADMGENADMGWNDYISSIDCMIMGRKCMEKISSFNMTPEQWPYGDIRIVVLSNTLKEPSDNLQENVEMYSGEIPALISQLEADGFHHAYIDGGTTITNFINLELIDEMTITRAPVVLGEGLPLFGKTNTHITLENAQAISYPNGFVQVRYDVKYTK